MLRAGSLDRRITLLQRHLSKGELNADVESWPDLCTVWASYNPLSDAERLRSAEVAATIEARFQIRWSPTVRNVDPTFRLRFDGKEFDILAVKELGRREGLEISATARGERRQ